MGAHTKVWRSFRHVPTFVQLAIHKVDTELWPPTSSNMDQYKVTVHFLPGILDFWIVILSHFVSNDEAPFRSFAFINEYW